MLAQPPQTVGDVGKGCGRLLGVAFLGMFIIAFRAIPRARRPLAIWLAAPLYALLGLTTVGFVVWCYTWTASWISDHDSGTGEQISVYAFVTLFMTLPFMSGWALLNGGIALWKGMDFAIGCVSAGLGIPALAALLVAGGSVPQLDDADSRMLLAGSLATLAVIGLLALTPQLPSVRRFLRESARMQGREPEF